MRVKCWSCGRKVSDLMPCEFCGVVARPRTKKPSQLTTHTAPFQNGKRRPFPRNREVIYTPSSSDEIIRLEDTVGNFQLGKRHYCSNCGRVCAHLDEQNLSNMFSSFGILSFLLPWKWALVATLFFHKDDKTQSVCVGCYPDFYEDWRKFKKIKAKRRLRKFAFSVLLLGSMFAWLYSSL